MCAVLFVFFFSSSVYPAIWPYWGMAKFGWSPAMIGVTLAVFGVVMALFQGVLTGPGVKRFGEHRMVIFGLISALLAAAGYGVAGSLAVVVVLMVVHGPEGFVHPMLTAMMTHNVPDDAQGELQGGISAMMNVAMLAGTVFFSQVFGYFMRPGGVVQSPDVGFYLAAAGMGLALVLFILWVPRKETLQ
jgi:DHA1 family tetracycline resistance protein-like MFS transporter